MVTPLWTHSYSYHVLVCTVNSHKKWCNYGTLKNVQSEKNDLALEGQLLFLKWVLSPSPAGLQTDINWLLPHLQTRDRRQATFVSQSNTQLPLAKWRHSSFWEFLLDFVWLTICARCHYSFWSHLKTRPYELVIGRILEYIIYFIVSGIWYKQMSSKIWL